MKRCHDPFPDYPPGQRFSFRCACGMSLSGYCARGFSVEDVEAIFWAAHSGPRCGKPGEAPEPPPAPAHWPICDSCGQAVSHRENGKCQNCLRQEKAARRQTTQARNRERMSHV